MGPVLPPPFLLAPFSPRKPSLRQRNLRRENQEGFEAGGCAARLKTTRLKK
jgi:hypothetical protein